MSSTHHQLTLTDTLHHAATHVKSNTPLFFFQSSVDFLDSVDGSGGGGNDYSSADAPTLRRKIHEVQVAHVNTIRELERVERLFQAQVDINRVPVQTRARVFAGCGLRVGCSCQVCNPRQLVTRSVERKRVRPAERESERPREREP